MAMSSSSSIKNTHDVSFNILFVRYSRGYSAYFLTLNYLILVIIDQNQARSAFIFCICICCSIFSNHYTCTLVYNCVPRAHTLSKLVNTSTKYPLVEGNSLGSEDALSVHYLCIFLASSKPNFRSLLVMLQHK